MINQNARRIGAAGAIARALGTLGAATLLLTSTGWGALAGDTGFGAINLKAYQGAAAAVPAARSPSNDFILANPPGWDVPIFWRGVPQVEDTRDGPQSAPPTPNGNNTATPNVYYPPAPPPPYDDFITFWAKALTLHPLWGDDDPAAGPHPPISIYGGRTLYWNPHYGQYE